MPNPSISIVTPACGAMAGLEKTIRSALDQNYGNLQYIVVGSADNTEAAETVAKYGQRITWINAHSKSNVVAINSGIAHCTGEIFGFLTCHSTLAPTTLSRIANSWENNTSWITGWAQCSDASGYDWPCQVQPMYQDIQWLQTDPVPPQASFWARRFFEQIGAFREDLELFFDYEFRLRLHFRNGQSPAVVRQCFVTARVEETATEAQRHTELRNIRDEYRKHLTLRHRAQLWWLLRQPSRNTAFADFTDLAAAR